MVTANGEHLETEEKAGPGRGCGIAERKAERRGCRVLQRKPKSSPAPAATAPREKGDVLVELDPEPYRVQVAIKKSALQAGETDLAAAQALVRGQVAQARRPKHRRWRPESWMRNWMLCRKLV